MAGTVLGLEKKRKQPVGVKKEKILPRKKMRLLGKDGSPVYPSFYEFSSLVDNIGKDQVASAYDPKDMIKIGTAVMNFGYSSKQVRQAQEEAKKVNRKAALEFVGDLHKIYRQQLEAYKDILDLPVCCICLSSTDDFEVRNSYSARQPNSKEEEDVDPAKAQFVKLSNMPPGSSYPLGLKCNCKNTAICMPCFFKLIRRGHNNGYIRVQCPTCRVIFCFKVGSLPRGDDHLLMISGIKPSFAKPSECPFRIPRIEESESESESEDEELDDENPIPRHASPSPPPRSPETPPLSPHSSPFPPPSGVPMTPSPPPRVRELRASTMNLRKRNVVRKGLNSLNPFECDSSSSDSEDGIDDARNLYGFGFNYDSDAEKPTAEDIDFIVYPTKSKKKVPDDAQLKEEKPEDGDNGYNHHLKWPKDTNQPGKRVDPKKWGVKIIPKN